MEIPTGFTEGPWIVFAPGSTFPGIDTRAGVSIVIFGEGSFDAEMCGVQGRSEDEAKANAHLISLAPDMAAELLALRADVTRLTASLAAAEAEARRLREAVKPFARAWRVAVDLLKSRTLADIETLAKHHTPGGAYQRAAALSAPAS